MDRNALISRFGTGDLIVSQRKVMGLSAAG